MSTILDERVGGFAGELAGIGVALFPRKGRMGMDQILLVRPRAGGVSGMPALRVF
jgi:hypothetical protein